MCSSVRMISYFSNRIFVLTRHFIAMPGINRHICLFVVMLNCSAGFGQETWPLVKLNVEYGQPVNGFEIFEIEDKDVVIIGEDAHNRIDMPRTTLKFLQYLHKVNDTRVLAIEAGSSTAWLINEFLESQDTLLLREIARHTFFWGVEHCEFLVELAKWNEHLRVDEKVKVVSADIEIKQESVVLTLNRLMQHREIPTSMSGLNTFRDVFEEKSIHRNQFDALNVRYYYDRIKCEKAAKETLVDINRRPDQYELFFGPNLQFVKTMLQDLMALYRFNYKDWNFVDRDEIIYQKLVNLHAAGVTRFLYVVGGKHTGVGASSYRLEHESGSPFNGRIVFVNITGKKTNGKFEGAKDVSELSRLLPGIFCLDCNVAIHNDGTNKLLTQIPDYTIAFKNDEHVRRFKNTFVGK